MTNTTSASQYASPSSSAEGHATLRTTAHLLRGHSDFRSQAEGSGIALFATGSPRTAGALTTLGMAGTRVPGEHQEKAAGCLVALVERAKQLACGAE
ncbi:hypothetical protein [Myxococcus xanthus]|uniref:Uncharacterized protein n=1 Tax=Myxococcus xanthus TaxID=34 RepID=A0A7Y4IQ91_MYXXA|nr:hypothetical protein [Myxococcus xanthus]NOJ83452.1 hypothetical protein [Myxococcus xanthus]NOJ91007.1 hypothetical protein [Myxococcus xanthus]